MNNNPALETIREVGIFGLCYYDGCACTHFNVHHVQVDISCHKSSGPSVLISSSSMDYFDDISPGGSDLLREVAEEVKKQLAQKCHYDEEDILVTVKVR